LISTHLIARDVAVEEHLPEIVKIIDNMKFFEKKKEKELKEEEEFKGEQLNLRTRFECMEFVAFISSQFSPNSN
jgi:hypothetical protein